MEREGGAQLDPLSTRVRGITVKNIYIYIKRERAAVGKGRVGRGTGQKRDRIWLAGVEGFG